MLTILPHLSKFLDSNGMISINTKSMTQFAVNYQKFLEIQSIDKWDSLHSQNLLIIV